MVSKMHKVVAILCVFSLIIPHLSAQNVDISACLTGKWQDSQELSAFGTTCKTSFRGSFYRWQWVWGGKFWCSSISATVMGESKNYKSRTGAIEHALQDFVTKAGQAGLLTKEQLSQYDKGK